MENEVGILVLPASIATEKEFPPLTRIVERHTTGGNRMFTEIKKIIEEEMSGRQASPGYREAPHERVCKRTSRALLQAQYHKDDRKLTIGGESL
ncbi:hypothetical protein V1502_02425 [Bacillus sp. SCS-153A]|uniref:hypothetical protein n=1 Tax=Rossellomorea sedimentorum TaxID=3115294 RepID=UPI003906B63C